MIAILKPNEVSNLPPKRIFNIIDYTYNRENKLVLLFVIDFELTGELANKFYISTDNNRNALIQKYSEVQ